MRTQNQNPSEPAKLQWGEIEDDNDGGENLDFLLPPQQIIGPDDNGYQKVIDYKFDEEGKMVKVVTTTRVWKLGDKSVNKRAVVRRSWARFGDAGQENVGSGLTMISTETVKFERTRAPGSKQEESQSSKSVTLMVCRTCGAKGEHWTSRCPYKDLAPPPPEDRPPTDSDSVSGKSYVPPNKRQPTGNQTGVSDMRRRKDENSVRVSNLSDDTREPDLYDLFQPFGDVSRVYVALDQKTGMSRGFGFVNFVKREDAQRAIDKLDGYGYDSLILRVEWSTPRTN